MSSAERSRSTEDSQEKIAYWGVVEDCLVRFHRMPKPSAHGKTNAFRKKLENPLPGISAVEIYHDEPFYVACDIAGMHEIQDQEELLKKHSRTYAKLKDTRGW